MGYSYRKEDIERRIEKLINDKLEVEKNAFTITALIGEFQAEGGFETTKLPVDILKATLQKAKEELLLYLEDYIFCTTIEKIAESHTEAEIAELTGECIYTKRRKKYFQREMIQDLVNQELLYLPTPGSLTEWCYAREIDAIIFRHNKRKDRNPVILDHEEEDITVENVNVLLKNIIENQDTNSVSLMTDILTLMIVLRESELSNASQYSLDTIKKVLKVRVQCISKYLMPLIDTTWDEQAIKSVDILDLVGKISIFVLCKHFKKFIKYNRLGYDRRITYKYYNDKGDILFVQFMAMDRVINDIMGKNDLLYKVSWKLIIETDLLLQREKCKYE